jgi:hypothetical protein
MPAIYMTGSCLRIFFSAVVGFSFVNDLVRDRYTPNFGGLAEDPESMLRLCTFSDCTFTHFVQPPVGCLLVPGGFPSVSCI